MVTITEALTLALESIDPAYASSTVPTAITLRATDPAPGGEVQFASTPRVYLNPSGAGVATALRAVIFEDAITLSAVIPDGMTPGVYDLVVVNPTGEVGLLAGGVTITTLEPPTVVSMAPGSLDASTIQNATILGSDFDPDAANMDVTMDCRDFFTGASVASPAVTVDTATATQLDITVAGNGGPTGAVCIVTVTNPDGSSFNYSAISFKNPSQNLTPWAASTAMQEPRRALGLMAGRPTSASRFVYAVGGDDGTAANTKVSVEAAPVDAFGAMGTWTYQRHDLGNAISGGAAASLPRAFAGAARVGRFLYMTGGDDTTGPTDTVLRAQILDPLAGPGIADLDARLGDATTGLGAGLWFYRIAALFPATDPTNPGGESLPGEVLNVQLPDNPDRIILTLDWAQVTGASGYRIYRSPIANGGVGDLELLVQINNGATVTFEDDGVATDPAANPPYVQGALGTWHQVQGAGGTLGQARAAHTSAAVPNPALANQWFLYAIGGRDGAGPLATGEFATITQLADGSQTVTGWSPLSANLAAARSEAPSFVVTDRETPLVGVGDTYLYVGPGWTGASTSSLVEAGFVESDGDILAFTTERSNVSRSGAAGLSADGFLFIFGGAGRSASNNDIFSEVVNPAPSLSNFNGLGGGAMQFPRIFMGATSQSAFFFIAGGATIGTSVGVTETVEQTIK